MFLDLPTVNSLIQIQFQSAPVHTDGHGLTNPAGLNHQQEAEAVLRSQTGHTALLCCALAMADLRSHWKMHLIYGWGHGETFSRQTKNIVGQLLSITKLLFGLPQLTPSFRLHGSVSQIKERSHRQLAHADCSVSTSTQLLPELICSSSASQTLYSRNTVPPFGYTCPLSSVGKVSHIHSHLLTVTCARLFTLTHAWHQENVYLIPHRGSGCDQKCIKEREKLETANLRRPREYFVPDRTIFSIFGAMWANLPQIKDTVSHISTPKCRTC